MVIQTQFKTRFSTSTDISHLAYIQLLISQVKDLDGQNLIIAFLHKRHHLTKSKTDAICFQEKKMLTLEGCKALGSEE